MLAYVCESQTSTSVSLDMAKLNSQGRSLGEFHEG